LQWESIILSELAQCGKGRFASVGKEQRAASPSEGVSSDCAVAGDPGQTAQNCGVLHVEPGAKLNEPRGRRARCRTKLSEFMSGDVRLRTLLWNLYSVNRRFFQCRTVRTEQVAARAKSATVFQLWADDGWEIELSRNARTQAH
jgi:hypothetical protein